MICGSFFFSPARQSLFLLLLITKKTLIIDNSMENISDHSNCMIAAVYSDVRAQLFFFIKNFSRILRDEDAEDIVQDTFVRLLEHPKLDTNTIPSLVFTIARNMTIDILRRHRIMEETYYSFGEDAKVCNDDCESQLVADDLADFEKKKISMLPPQRRKIYILNRFGGKTVCEIVEETNLSRRTVENHLFIGRKEMREYMRQCI